MGCEGRDKYLKSSEGTYWSPLYFWGCRMNWLIDVCFLKINIILIVGII